MNLHIKYSLARVALITLTLAGCGKTTGEFGNHQTTPQAQIHFSEVSQESGISFSRQNGAFGKKWMPETMGGGGAMFDFDQDGNIDLLLINGDWWDGHPLPGNRPTLTLYHNEGNGQFKDVTKSAGLDFPIQGMGVAVGDYDNDGWPDIYITGVGGNRLLHNNGGRRFTDVTATAGVRDSGWSTSAAWLDYDNDGKLDLFVCHYVKWSPAGDQFCGTTVKTYCLPQVYDGESCRLFHNEGNGRFTDVTKKAGIYNEASKGLSVCILDFNHDNKPDIFVACDMTPNLLFRNNGNGTFKEMALEFGIGLGANGSAHASMGVSLAEYKSPGTYGIAIGNFTNDGVFIYDLPPDGSHAELSHQPALQSASIQSVTFGLGFADLDNDGFADIVGTNGHVDDLIQLTNAGSRYAQPSFVCRNLGNGTFVDVSPSMGPEFLKPIVGRGLCLGDINNDGKVDVLMVPNIGSPRLFLNDTAETGHWLSIRLQGTKSNRDGYGATVKIHTPGRTFSAYSQSGSSYLSANDSRLHFGLGKINQIEKLSVVWPSGLTESWNGIAVDKQVTLKEGTGTAEGQ